MFEQDWGKLAGHALARYHHGPHSGAEHHFANRFARGRARLDSGLDHDNPATSHGKRWRRNAKPRGAKTRVVRGFIGGMVGRQHERHVQFEQALHFRAPHERITGLDSAAPQTDKREMANIVKTKLGSLNSDHGVPRDNKFMAMSKFACIGQNENRRYLGGSGTGFFSLAGAGFHAAHVSAMTRAALADTEFDGVGVELGSNEDMLTSGRAIIVIANHSQLQEYCYCVLYHVGTSDDPIP